MNIKLIMSILSLCMVTAVAAQTEEQPDTVLTQELQEFVVEGRTQRVIDHGVEYIPSKRVKKAAYDATSLLRLMNVPQLNVSPIDMTVKTFTGKDVAMFIDYIPATSQDLQGLRTEDVIRIEVLQYPDDPRFNNAANVVNFIMRKYHWGGYTKLTANGSTLNVDQAGALVYSKLVSGKWTVDANASGSIFYNSRNYASLQTETYHDFPYDGKHIDNLTRTMTNGDDDLSKNNSQYASVRAAYNTPKSFISHTLSFFRNASPIQRGSTLFSFSENIIPASGATSTGNSQSITPAINAYYFFSLPKDNFLSITWDFAHSGTHQNSNYTAGSLTPIINNSNEKSYSPNTNIQYSKKFSHNNTFRTSFMSYNTWYDTHYAGSYDGTQKLLSSENMLFLEYMQNWKWGLSLYSRVGASYVIGRVNGSTTLNQWNPRLGVDLDYRINDRHSVSFDAWWGNSHPQPSSANSAIVQSNELLWLQGNPDLKNTIFNQATASYTFIPTNHFSLSAAAKYEANYDKQACDYYTMPDYNGLICRYINSGNFYSYSALVSATVNLFNNSLSLQGTLSARRAVLTGIDARSDNRLVAGIYANYLIKGFAFMLYYQSPESHIDAWSNGMRTHYNSTYGLSVNYNFGNFHCGIQFRNWFNDNKIYMDFASPHYSANGWARNMGLSRALTLTLSYTFAYGKKVNHNDELNSSSDVKSAILK